MLYVLHYPLYLFVYTMIIYSRYLKNIMTQYYSYIIFNISFYIYSIVLFSVSIINIFNPNIFYFINSLY